MNLLFNEKVCAGKFRIGTIWNYLFNRAVNSVVKQFNGKEENGSYGWLHRCSSKDESCFSATCTGTRLEYDVVMINEDAAPYRT